jgi:hypothetical protein
LLAEYVGEAQQTLPKVAEGSTYNGLAHMPGALATSRVAGDWAKQEATAQLAYCDPHTKLVGRSGSTFGARKVSQNKTGAAFFAPSLNNLLLAKLFSVSASSQTQTNLTR